MIVRRVKKRKAPTIAVAGTIYRITKIKNGEKSTSTDVSRQEMDDRIQRLKWIAERRTVTNEEFMEILMGDTKALTEYDPKKRCEHCGRKFWYEM